MRYVILEVASDIEAQRLIDDLSDHPGEPLRTPRWGNAVHATLSSLTGRDGVSAEARRMSAASTRA